MNHLEVSAELAISKDDSVSARSYNDQSDIIAVIMVQLFNHSPSSRFADILTTF